MRSPRELERIAYHEAGHAVMHVLECIGFKHASILPDEEEGSAGHVQGSPLPKWLQPEWDRSTRTRLRLESLVRIDLAGQVAEQILRGRKSWNRGSGADTTMAFNLLSYLTENGDHEETINVRFHLLLLETRNTLSRPWHWAQVKAVADALLRDKVLSSRRVRRIMTEADESWFRASTEVETCSR